MKVIKKFTTILAITGLLLTSCDSKKEYNLELSDGTSVFYNSDDENAISVDGWSDFNSTNETLIGLERSNYTISMARLENLGSSIANLSNTIPSSLKTEEVLEDIDDVQEEYKKLITEKSEPLKNVKQNIEELVEKFDDLREELNETVEDYIS